MGAFLLGYIVTLIALVMQYAPISETFVSLVFLL
jgi:hypothetical protein